MLEDGGEPDRRRLRQIAAATGLGLKFLSKEVFLTRFLRAISGGLGPEFVMKGGTAISRAGYLKVPRFSEDIDLDYFGGSGIKEATAQILTLAASVQGFEMDRPRHQGRCHRIDVRFTNHWDERDRIRVDITAPMELGEDREPPDSDKAAATILRPQFTEGAESTFRTYTRHHLFVKKLKALSDRKEGKDAFDIWGMTDGGLRLEQVIDLLQQLPREGHPPQDLLTHAMHNLRYMSSNIRTVSNAANHFIPRPHRPNWEILLRDVGDILITLDEAVR